MAAAIPALDPLHFLRSIDATRASLAKVPMKLIELVERVQDLTDGAPYAVIGGLAQILWARKSHTDDLDVVLAAGNVAHALAKVTAGRAPDWTEPLPPDRTREDNEIIEVCHLLHRGAVVDLIAFRHTGLNEAIINSAQTVKELGDVRFIRPELLFVTHLLRPGPEAALAAVELLLGRRERGGFDLGDARHWAAEVERSERLERVVAQAEALRLV